MKKGIIQTMIIILVCCLLSTVNADAFQLRNGIQFGDSLETVKSKEKLELKESEISEVTCYYGVGTIAGYDDGEVDFYFNNSNSLIDMNYKIRTVGSSAETVFTTLRDSVTNKYGQPLGNTNGKTHIITGRAFKNALSFVSTSKSFNISSGLLGYEEWIVECDGGAVKIDLVYIYSGQKELVYLSYHFCTSEEINGLIQEQQDKRDAINEDI